jgi:tRNA A37 threonylcarbamoyltransferase TsaD
MTQMTALTEMKVAQQAMIANVYAKAYAASLTAASRVGGIIPEVDARQAVKNFIAVMNDLEPSMWYGYKLESV